MHLEPRQVRAEPARSASIALRVRNTGAVVDEIRIELAGAAAEWARVVPASLRLFPGTDGQAEITLQPPRSPQASAGFHELAIRVVSRERPAASVEESAGVEIAAYDDLAASLSPRYGSTKRDFTSAIRLVNQGNRAVAPTIRASDPHHALDLQVQPEQPTVPPGNESTSWLRAHPRRTIWFGHGRMHPFEVTVNLAGSTPRSLDGRLEQLPLLPRWLAAVGALVLAALIVTGAACGTGLVQCGPTGQTVATPTPIGLPTPPVAPTDPSPTATPPPATPTATPPVVITTAPPDLAGCVLTVERRFVRLREEPVRFGARELGNVEPGRYTPFDARVVTFVGPELWFQIQVGPRIGWIVDDGFDISAKSDECP